MKADIKLGAHTDDEIHIEGRLARLSTTDVLLDAPERRSQSGGHRRALVHDSTDGLTINFNGDYPGGVTINGKIHGPDLDAATVNLAVEVHQEAPALPRVARPGDLRVIHVPSSVDGVQLEQTTVWLCIPREVDATGSGGARWVQLALSEPVEGTA